MTVNGRCHDALLLPDVLEEIFMALVPKNGYVTDWRNRRDRQRSLRCVVSVCRCWAQVGLPMLWSDMNLEDALSSVAPLALLNQRLMFPIPPTPEDWTRIRPRLGDIRSLTSTSRSISSGMVADLAACGAWAQPPFPKLTMLTWLGCEGIPPTTCLLLLSSSLRELILSDQRLSYAAVVMQLPSICPNLCKISLHLSRCSNTLVGPALKELHRLVDVSVYGLTGLDQVTIALRSHPLLRKLHLKSSGELTQWPIDGSGTEIFFPSLEEMHVNSPVAGSLANLLESMQGHSQLRRLVLRHSHRFAGDDISFKFGDKLRDFASLVDAVGLQHGLRTLSIAFDQVKPPVLADLWSLTNCHNLEVLSIILPVYLQINDDEFGSWIRHLGRLRNLEVNAVQQSATEPVMTLQTLFHCITHCPLLEYLCLNLVAGSREGGLQPDLPTARHKHLQVVVIGPASPILYSQSVIAAFIAGLSERADFQLSAGIGRGGRLEEWREIGEMVAILQAARSSE